MVTRHGPALQLTNWSKVVKFKKGDLGSGAKNQEKLGYFG